MHIVITLSHSTGLTRPEALARVGYRELDIKLSLLLLCRGKPGCSCDSTCDKTDPIVDIVRLAVALGVPEPLRPMTLYRMAWLLTGCFTHMFRGAGDRRPVPICTATAFTSPDSACESEHCDKETLSARSKLD